MRTAVELPVVGLIYNRYKRASATQDAVVEIRVYYQRKTKYMSTRVRLFPKEWKNGLVVNRVDAIILNKQLDQLLVDIRKVIFDMYEDGNIDIDAIPARLIAKRKPSVAFIEFCEQRSKIRKYGKAADSQERYERFMRFLKEYGKFKTFYDLTEQKVMELDRFLQKKNDMKAKSRWNNYHRFLNSFILDAQKEGLLKINPYDRVKIDKGNDYDGIDKSLSPEEFEKLRTAKMPSERLERVRDRFVFQCYFCQSVKDLHKFNPSLISEVDGKKVYLDPRCKTGKKFTVPLLPPALEILKKYNGQLPKISDTNYNDYLKEVASEAGLPYALTTHWARHTGGSLLLNAGVPIEVVCKVLGHASIKMTERIYAKMFSKTIVNEVAKVSYQQTAKQKFQNLLLLAVSRISSESKGDEKLKEEFNEYFEWYENMVMLGNLVSFGGAPGSRQNRSVLAGQITRAVRFGDFDINEQQLDTLKEILTEIVTH